MLFRLKPKREKFKRLHKGLVPKCQFRSSAVRPQQGALALCALKSGLLTAKQLEQARRKIILFRKKKTQTKSLVSLYSRHTCHPKSQRSSDG